MLITKFQKIRTVEDFKMSDMRSFDYIVFANLTQFVQKAGKRTLRAVYGRADSMERVLFLFFDSESTLDGVVEFLQDLNIIFHEVDWRRPLFLIAPGQKLFSDTPVLLECFYIYLDDHLDNNQKDDAYDTALIKVFEEIDSQLITQSNWDQVKITALKVNKFLLQASFEAVIAFYIVKMLFKTI